MEGFLRDVLDTADKLGLSAWEHLVLVLVAALMFVVIRRSGRRVWEALKQIEWKFEPAPRPLSDGETAADRDNPPAQAGEVPGDGNSEGRG